MGHSIVTCVTFEGLKLAYISPLFHSIVTLKTHFMIDYYLGCDFRYDMKIDFWLLFLDLIRDAASCVTCVTFFGRDYSASVAFTVGTANEGYLGWLFPAWYNSLRYILLQSKALVLDLKPNQEFSENVVWRVWHQNVTCVTAFKINWSLHLYRRLWILKGLWSV